jgi:hypothetical protein
MFSKLTLIAGAGAILISGAFFAYYKVASAQILALKLSVQQLEIAIEQQVQTINTLQATHKRELDSLRTLATAHSKAAQEKQELVNNLVEHDLENLATQKPGLIEKVINNGTKDYFDSINSITAR